MKCGFCKVQGHTIRSCRAPGIEEELSRRANDPKIIAAKASVLKKKAEHLQVVQQQLHLSSEPVPLHKPTIIPGRVKQEIGGNCTTIEGVIETVLPSSYLSQILEIGLFLHFICKHTHTRTCILPLAHLFTCTHSQAHT